MAQYVSRMQEGPFSSLKLDLSQMATPTMLFQLSQQLEVSVDSMVLSVTTDGTRYAYLNFDTPDDADLAKDQIEFMKVSEERYVDEDMFTSDSEVFYTTGKPARIQGAPGEKRSIRATFLHYSITSEDLDYLGHKHLGVCGYEGVTLTHFWGTKRGTSELRFAVCHAVFIFYSPDHADFGRFKLWEMEEAGKLWFMTGRSTLKWGHI